MQDISWEWQGLGLPENTLSIAFEPWNPHAVLGLHSLPSGERVVRLYRPGAHSLFFELHGRTVEMERLSVEGLFVSVVPPETSPLEYRVYTSLGELVHDPYAFLPTVGEYDAYFFGQGTHYRLYEILGSHLCTHQGCRGVRFALWAPAARRVSVVGDFNLWDGRLHPMRSMGGSGIWELFLPDAREGMLYKFEIETAFGELLLKTDPYSFQCELRPKTASLVAELEGFSWQDEAWMQRRFLERDQEKPLAIYEVHLGSWRRGPQGFLNYRELAHLLAAYCKEMGFTHVELMGLLEHPLDESWGYQVSCFYAATSRFGSPRDFQYFVDHLHREGIGVLIDWVPAHFPQDAHSLGRFDGTALYEHRDERQGLHPHWNTYIFNYGRKEVSNFLIANALFWFDKMHIDGLRVDAVASMLYLDYGRNEGEWIPNCYGGRENLEAIEFLKHLNSIVHTLFPGVLTIAEESTAFLGVTHAVDHGGLGFDLKWNMGWMNDTLAYFAHDSLFRSYHQDMLTFGLVYAFSERFALVLSHDEVVHGKRSLLSKMPGDNWQKFAQLRLLYSYLLCQPGKKLLFMGGELGQWSEWWCQEEIHWHLLNYSHHFGIQLLVKDLNHFYLSHPALWHDVGDGFEWVDFSDRENCVLAYKRKAPGLRDLLCVHNMTPSTHAEYLLRMPYRHRLEARFHTDALCYGGSGQCDLSPKLAYNAEGEIVGSTLLLAPLGTTIYEVFYE